MGFDDWPPKDYTPTAGQPDLADEIFGTAGRRTAVRPEPAPAASPSSPPTPLPEPPTPADPGPNIDLLVPGGPSVEDVKKSRPKRAKPVKRSRPPLPRPAFKLPALPTLSASTTERAELLRSLVGLAAGVFVWVVVVTGAEVSAGAAMMVSATAAAVTAVVAFARGWRAGLVFAVIAALVSLASAHWWWAGAAGVLVLASVVDSGWNRR